MNPLTLLLLLLLLAVQCSALQFGIGLQSFFDSKAALETFLSIGKKRTPVTTASHLRRIMFETSPRPPLSAVRIVELPPPPSLRPSADEHAVLSLLRSRLRRSPPPPLAPHSDGQVLSLCIEGGGMRGCVSAGMAAAVMALNLTEAFDSVYGSSAGAVVGTYFVARQLDGLHPETVVEGTKKESIWASFKSLPSLSLFFSESNSTSAPAAPSRSPRSGVVRHRKLLASTVEAALNQILSSPFFNMSIPASHEGFSATTFLNNVMCPVDGVVPLDLEAFRENAKRQTMNVVACDLDFRTMAFNTSHFEGEIAIDGGDCLNDEKVELRSSSPVGEATTTTNNSTWTRMRQALAHFFSSTPDAIATTATIATANQTSPFPPTETDLNPLPPPIPTKSKSSSYKENLFAALTRSMSVPGVSGALSGSYFDALAYECIPYRSAVYCHPPHLKSHVLVLRTRPVGAQVDTQSDMQSQLLAAQFFKKEARGRRGDKVATYFENLGPTYRYAEDILTLREGTMDRSEEGIPIPPREVVWHGPEILPDSHQTLPDETLWRKAHVMSIAIDSAKPDIRPIEQNRAVIMEGFRAGFETAYDELKWAVGGDAAKEWSGKFLAEVMFADSETPGRGKAKKTRRTQELSAEMKEEIDAKIVTMLPGLKRDDEKFKRVQKALAVGNATKM